MNLIQRGLLLVGLGTIVGGTLKRHPHPAGDLSPLCPKFELVGAWAIPLQDDPVMRQGHAVPGSNANPTATTFYDR